MTYVWLVEEFGPEGNSTGRTVQEFAALVQAAERERCASLVERRDIDGHAGYIEDGADLIDALAARIRRP